MSGAGPGTGAPPDAREVVPSVARNARPGPPARVVPTWTEPLATTASRVVGGPLGRHALVGRSPFWTPLRVVLLMAVTVLAAGLVRQGAVPAAVHDAPRGSSPSTGATAASTSRCATRDTVPLYGVERLDSGLPALPDSWLENAGTAQEQVRYMEYPVLTGFFQYANARLADAWLWLADRATVVPAALPVVVYFDLSARLARAGLAGHGLGGPVAAPAGGRGTPRWSRCRRWSRCTRSPTSTRWPSACATGRAARAGPPATRAGGRAARGRRGVQVLPAAAAAARCWCSACAGATRRGRAQRRGRGCSPGSRW